MAPLLHAYTLSSLIALLAVVTAAPTLSGPGAIDRRLEIDVNLIGPPAYADPPDGEGPWIACDFSDDDCGCTSVNGLLRYYCGWVDPTWTIGDSTHGHWGRILSETGPPSNDSLNVDPDTADPNSPDEQMLDLGDIPDADFTADAPQDPEPPAGTYLDDNGNPDTTSPAPAGATTGAPDARRRDIGREIRLRRRHPLHAALRIIGFSYRKLALTTLQCITTKLPKTEQGQYVQGIEGTLTEALQVDDGDGFRAVFRKGAKFVLRWDITGIQQGGTGANDPFTGLHVNMLLDDGTTQQKWGFYQLGTANFPNFPDFLGQFYRIRTHLTNVAGYFPGNPLITSRWANSEETGPGLENAAAQAIAKVWHNFNNPHDEL